MVQKKTTVIDLNFIPENIKNLAWRTSKDNAHVTEHERNMARGSLEQIIAYCEKILEKK